MTDSLKVETALTKDDDASGGNGKNSDAPSKQHVSDLLMTENSTKRDKSNDETNASAIPSPTKRLKENDSNQSTIQIPVEHKSKEGTPNANATHPNEMLELSKPSIQANAPDACVEDAKDQKTAESMDQDTGSGSGSSTTMPIANETELHRFKRIPIFIVDYHNEVLEFIIRCIGSRHLSAESNILVHFDSHPDMVISRDMKASTAHEKETLLCELSIENWIMPMCYAGYINRVVWLKNSWCQQIPTGTYNFDIGQKDDKISVNCPLEYFISEGNYCDSNELLNARPMQLQVHNMNDPSSSSSSSTPTTTTIIDPNDILKSEDGGKFILDIDLDYFSVTNPFLEIYKNVNCYQQLTEIFHFENTADTSSSTERRKKQLQALRNIFMHLEEERTLEGLETPDPQVISVATFTKIQKLVETLKKNYEEEEIDWLLIYDSGSTTDTNGLPHHISTKDELEQYFGEFKTFLQRLPAKPVIITIARSAEDDFCPNHQVNLIEREILRILYEVFGDQLHETPINHYLDDKWDVWRL